MNRKPAKSTFDNVMNLFNSIPPSHEKALKHGVYNAIGLFLFCICGAAGWGVLYVFGPFVKPLMWALLTGSVLHPLKYSVEKKLAQWINLLQESSTPSFFFLFLIPIRLIDDVSETIRSSVVSNAKYLMVLALGTVTSFILYTCIPWFCISILTKFCEVNYQILMFLMDNLSTKVFIAVVIGYAIILTYYWSEESSHLFSVASYGVWLIISIFAARSFGVLQVPLFLLIVFFLSFGFAFEVMTVLNVTAEIISCWKTVTKTLSGSFYSEEKVNNEGISVEKIDSESSTEKPVRESFLLSAENPQNDSECVNHTQDSWKYINALLWACSCMIIWKNLWIAHLLPIPIAVYFIKNIGIYLGIWEVIYSHWQALMENVKNWMESRERALFPAPVQGLRRLGARLRVTVLNGVDNLINSFSSSLVIFGIIFFAFLFTIFIALQIYTECIHLITVGAEIINQTIVHNPEFRRFLPDGWGEKMDFALNNAYLYGREGISRQVQNLLKDVEKSKAAEFEAHILECWDRIYQAWLMNALETSHIGPKVSSNAVYSSWGSFLDLFYKTPDLLNVKVMSEFAKENVGTLMSLLDSIWAILKGNINLIFQFFFVTLNIILGGGSAVINFLVSVIVFLTALFYLLNSSRAVYKPVELLYSFSRDSGDKLGVAFEAAVNGVFKASFKMALFYGLWTWLIHNLFHVRIVYLPSVLAAILGAVPFLGTYWAAIPAVLDLWLAHQKGIQGLILLAFQCLPMSFVDAGIYAEIKGGGHPYMTALAVAGGVFCMGIEGAILGPVLLCLLLVTLNMSSSLMKAAESTEMEENRMKREFDLRRLNTDDVPMSVIDVLESLTR